MNSSDRSLKADTSFLVVLMGSIGDVVRGLAVASQIKSSLPGSRITWLIEEKSLEAVRCSSRIDRIIVFERKKGLKALLPLYRELRSEKFDVCLDMQRHFKSGLFSLMSGAPRRIGFNRKDCKEFNWLFNNEQIAHKPGEHAKLDDYLAFVEKLGLKIQSPPDFGLSHMADAPECREVLGQIGGPFVGLVLGSSWESKDWMLPGYDGLIKDLLRRYSYKIVLLGDRSQKQRADELVKSSADPRVINLAGVTTLRQVIGIVARSHFCIGPDSGPGHMAGALGRPYISLFGPTSPVKTAPFGSEDLVVRSEIPCSPCYRRECPGLNKLCMRLISVKAVMDKVAVLEQPGS